MLPSPTWEVAAMPSPQSETDVSPPSLLQEAFEILARGNHQGEAVDAARADVSESVASHATACLLQRAVRSRLSAGFAPCGKQGSAHRLSLGPDSGEKGPMHMPTSLAFSTGFLHRAGIANGRIGAILHLLRLIHAVCWQ